VFNPPFAKTISLVAANHCIEKLKHYPCLNKPAIIQALNTSFKYIKEAADKVASSDVDVLQWHLNLNARLNKEIEEDARVHKCRHCKKNPVCCNCGKHDFFLGGVHAHWLSSYNHHLLPLNDFSQSFNNMWTDQQTSAFSDMIKISLFLRYNK
jgi:hypothetical protein